MGALMTVASELEFAVEELKPEIGSRVIADKALLLSGANTGELRALLERRGVLAFPEIHFTDAEQIAFTRTLGAYVADRADGGATTISFDPDVADNADFTRTSVFWHFDGYMNDVPIRGSILSARVLSLEGGDTCFANTYAAWDALPPERKRQIEGLRAVHAHAAAHRSLEPEPSFARFCEWQVVRRNTLPLVWTHRSGRKSLVVGNTAAGIVGMDPLDSLELMTWLRDWATQEQFTYRHRWSVGDAVLWDNTGTLHKVMPYAADSGRLMLRTKLAGEEPFA
jgi:alpha-ketoglutarate-dependent taurine dioxygenase